MAETYSNIKGQEINIEHYRGDKFDEVWQIAKDDASAYDLSGKTLVLTIKVNKSDGTAAETLTTTDTEITISGDDNDIITFNKVVSLSQGVYYYDLEIEEDNYTIAYGTWKEIGDVTR